MRSHFLATLLLVAPTLAFAQGALAPTGAPAPTMKSLDQIEPRIPLKASSPGVTANANGGFNITAPGSYYLTGNINVTLGNGILLYANNVTLDLNGFTLSSSAPSPNGGIAIWITAAFQNITIRNGHIYGALTVDPSTRAATGSGFSDGINGYSTGIICRVTDVSIHGVSNNGIYLADPGRTTIERCDVDSCKAIGILADVVINSSASACGSYGIFATTAIDSSGTSYSSGGTGVYARGTASNCRASNTDGGYALSAKIAIGCTVDEGSISATNRYNMP